MNRRQFFKSMAIVGAAVAFPSVAFGKGWHHFICAVDLSTTLSGKCPPMYFSGETCIDLSKEYNRRKFIQ